jgi:hypothetical protein
LIESLDGDNVGLIGLADDIVDFVHVKPSADRNGGDMSACEASCCGLLQRQVATAGAADCRQDYNLMK